MSNAAKPTTIAQYHAAQSPGDRASCNKLRKIIDAALPDATSKLWHGHPVWLDAGNPLVGYSKLKHCIRLLFWSGQTFTTPGLKPEGKFKAAEVRYANAKQIDEEALRQWIAEAWAVQWDYANIVKRKGKLVRLK